MTDRQAIEAQIEKFITSYNAGDLEGVMHCYSDDLIKTRHGAPPENHAETKARLRDVMRDFSGALEVVNDEIAVSGDIAYARGSLSIILTPRNGDEPKQLKRRFLEIWRKTNGTWLVVRTMDNID